MEATWTLADPFAAGSPARRTRPRARAVFGVVAITLVLAVAFERAVIAAPSGTPDTGGLRVEGVDTGGRASSHLAVIDVSGAYPGMPAKTSTFEVRNTSTMPVSFSVASQDLVASGPRSLDEVLRLVVRDADSGRVVYRGRLSGLRVDHGRPLEAGGSATYAVQVTWPDTANDELYQGAGLTFSVVASPGQ